MAKANLCQFKNEILPNGQFKHICQICGTERISNHKNYTLPCRNQSGRKVYGLGDQVAYLLDSMGLTKEFTTKWLGTTGCAKRQEKLNKLGVYLTKKAKLVGIKLPWEEPVSTGAITLKWSYGVTTIQNRFTDLLPRTLASLAKAGFDRPHILIDGPGKLDPILGCEITQRSSPVRCAGHWILSAYELYIRDPHADRYMVFQDDLVTYPNLKEYLEKIPYPEMGYCNLYTYPHNEVANQKGWYPSTDQNGKGAIALMFDNAAMVALLSDGYMVRRIKNPTRGQEAVDGGIVECMRALKYKEYVHNPTLVQHTGLTSSMVGHRPNIQAPSFKGEDFNPLTLLEL